MAGQSGYYAVSLDNGAAGIVEVDANQQPVSVGGHSVTRLSYLGTTEQDILANWTAAVNKIGAYGLFELGPPGSQHAIIGSGTDLGTLIKDAETKGSGILTQTPSGAEWDPTFTAIAGGLGGIVSGAVRASAAGAAEAAAADTASAGTGVGTTAAASAAAQVASKAAEALTGVGAAAVIWNWLTTAKNWVRVLEYIGGAMLIYIGIKGLTGIDVGPGDGP